MRVVTDIEKKLKVKKWTAGEWFGKYGISFSVVEEDGKKVNKQFTAVSRRLIRELKPIVQKAEQDARDTIGVAILRTGEGLNTRYLVSEFPLNLKELLFK